MKKTVVFDFPDDFQFPEHFDEKRSAKCSQCFFYCADNEWNEWCILTGDCDETPISKRKKCPFFDGTDTVNYYLQEMKEK